MFTTSKQQLPCDALYSRLSSNRSRQLVGYGGRDGAVHVFPFAGRSPIARLEGLTSPVTSLAFSPDQSSVVAGSDTGGLRLWNLSTEESTQTFNSQCTSTITNVEFHSSRHWLASVSTDGNLRFWDTRKPSYVQSYWDTQAPLCAVRFSPNEQWVATGCAHGVVRIYNLRAARLEAKLQLHTGAITSLSFHPEVFLMAAGSGDATVSVWNLETFQCKFRSASANTPVDNVQFCGNHLLAALDHQLHVYDSCLPSDETVVALEAPWTIIGDMAYVAFSDEAWFVESDGSTATTGRMRLSMPSGASVGSVTPPDAPLLLAGSDRNHSKAAPANPTSRAQHPPAAKRKVASPPPTGAQPHTRIRPTLPRSQRLAVQENYVVEKPASTNHTSHKPTGHDPFSLLNTASRVPAPEVPEVPFVDEGGAELDVVDQLISTSHSCTALLNRRLNHLRAIRSFWSQDQRAALEHLRQVCESGDEAGAVYDFLTTMQQQRMKERMTMEALPDLLDVVQCSLYSSYDPLLLVALRTLRSMNTKFRARVDESQRRNRLSQSCGHNDPLGVSNAGSCAERFGACSGQVAALSKRRDAIGEEARYLIGELPSPPSQ